MALSKFTENNNHGHLTARRKSRYSQILRTDKMFVLLAPMVLFKSSTIPLSKLQLGNSY